MTVPLATRVRWYALFVAHSIAYLQAFKLPHRRHEAELHRLRTGYPIRADRLIGRGVVPGVRLQRLRRRPRVRAVLDRVLGATYFAWAPQRHVALLWLIARHPRAFPRAAMLVGAAFDVSLAYQAAVPTAPPWWAAQQAILDEPLHRVTVDASRALPLVPEEDADARTEANPWASMPSNHTASAVALALALADVDRRAGAAAGAYAAVLDVRARLPGRALCDRRDRGRRRSFRDSRGGAGSGMSSGPPATVFLRPIGSPVALGLSGLVAASLVASGVELGWVAVDERAHAAVAILAFAFPLQFAASLLAFAARDGAVGTANGILSGAWLATSLVWLTSLPGSVSGSLGLLLLAAAGLLAAAAASAATGKLMPAVVFLAEALRFALVGIHELGGSEFWQNAGGVVGLVVVALAGYTMLAVVLEDARDRTVLPIGRRGSGPQPEPGVRRQL